MVFSLMSSYLIQFKCFKCDVLETCRITSDYLLAELYFEQGGDLVHILSLKEKIIQLLVSMLVLRQR